LAKAEFSLNLACFIELLKKHAKLQSIENKRKDFPFRASS